MEKIDKSVKATSIPQEGERRQATILFADISGFTSMSEKMDPEEVSSIVNECLGDMGTIIEKNGGTVDKYIGDCVMALFGIPTAIEEAPRKAVNAAIEIRNMIEEFNQSRKLEKNLGVHIGINTGIVITGAVGKGKRQDDTAIGNSVNVASRLKDASTSGQIFAGASTYDQTKDHFEYKELDPIRLKGKQDPVSSYELLSTRGKIHRPKLGAERMIASEMVGRDEELNKLSLQLQKLLNGEGSIVSVIGEAGIGKSRLIAELRRKEEIRQVTFLEGRALSIGKNLSFHPLIDILKNWSGIKEEDADQDKFQKLGKAIKQIDPEETAEILPFIATLMGLSLTGKYADRIAGIEGEALEKLILKNLYTLIEKGTTIKPVVLILEDLHWADLTSIEFFGSLYRLALQNRILFINVFRPGYRETGEHILKTINDRYADLHYRIELKSLADDQSSLLINNLLKIKGFPTNIKSLIVHRTAGNPFFIEEVARSFIDEGVIEVRNEKFEVTDKIHTVTIPETINEVLLARIDRLDAQSRSLLKVASVIGRSFFYRILAKVIEKTQQMDEKLAYLEEIQLIREQKRKTELEYLFKHALAQEATYESILIQKRKELHLKTAEAIESIFTEKLPEFYGMLAMHYSRAGKLDKAEEYLLKAADEALRKSASREAISYYQDGLRLYQDRYGESVDPQKIAMMQKNLAIAFQNKGRLIEAIEYFDKVLDHYGRTIPSSLNVNPTLLNSFFQFLIAIYLPFLKWKKAPTPRDLEVMELLFQQLNNLALADTARMIPGVVLLLKTIVRFDLRKTPNGPMMVSGASNFFSFAGISFTLSRKTLDFLRDKINKNNIKECIYYSFASRTNDMLEGTWNKHMFDKELYEKALNVGEVQYANYLMSDDFYIDIERGSFISANEKIKRFGEISQDFDYDWAEGTKLQANALLLMKSRKLDDAILECDLCEEFLNKLNDKVRLFITYSIKAYTQVLLKDFTGATTTLQIAKSFRPNYSAPWLDSRFLICQFSLDLSQLEIVENGNKNMFLNRKAIRSGKKLLNCSKKVALFRTEAIKLMGTCYWLINKQRRAHKWWRKSIKEGEKLGARLELSRTYFEIGRRLLEDQSKYQVLDGITAREYLDKARTMFEEMELDWDLKQLDKIQVSNLKYQTNPNS